MLAFDKKDLQPLLVALCLCAVPFIVFEVWQAEKVRVLSEIEKELDLSTKQANTTITQLLHKYTTDIRFLSQVPPISGIARATRNDGLDPVDNSSIAVWKARLTRIFEAYLRAHREVVQARYIGIADRGRELVRVEVGINGVLSNASEQALQQKAHRPYMIEPPKLLPGETWVSHITLNREHGKVETPHRPMARVATPVFGVDGSAFGVIVLNINAGPLLQNIADQSAENRSIYLLDSDGNFLVHPDPKRTFGFDLDHPARFSDEFSEVHAPTISAPTVHVYRTPGGIVVGRHRQVALGPDRPDPFVELVATTPREVVYSRLAATLTRDLGLAAAASGIVLLILGLYVLRVRERFRGEQDRSRLAAVVNGSSEAFVGLNTNGRVSDWNQSATHLLGPSRREALGRTLPTVLAPHLDLMPAHLPCDWLTSPERKNVVLEGRGPAGNQLHLELKKGPIITPDGKQIGTALLFRDISAERAYQERLKEMNTKLEQQVEERTASLKAAQQAAVHSAAAKSQFLANMTHEIRTPMNAILGTLQLMRGTHLSGSQRRYADTAETAAQALLRVLNDILDYSKIEAGKLVLHQEAFLLKNMLREVAVVSSANLGSKTIELAFDIAPLLPGAIVSDALRLQQILLNLLSNAIKFTEQGHVVLRANFSHREDGKIDLTFSIADTGIGLSADQLSHVFEGFEQAEGSTTRRFGGTGLGLTISRHLVDLMGGQLAVESKPGRGSVFSFTISVATDPALAAQDRRADFEGVKKLAVLLVDQPGIHRNIIEGAMRAFGWDVVLAESSEQARELQLGRRAGSKNFDILLLNGHLPQTEVVRIAQDTATAGNGAPRLVVMATIYAQSGLVAAYRDIEKRARFLIKPTTPSQLYESLVSAHLGDFFWQNALRSEHPPIGRLAGIRILAVDDNRLNQRIAVELLEKEAAQVTVADNGREALRVLRAQPHRFDVVLMDVHMPEMDGYEATRTVRTQMGIGPAQLPIIAMTANATRSDREACMKSGMNDHVGKPFYVDDLVDCIRRHALRSILAGPATDKVFSGQEEELEQPAMGADLDIASAGQRFGGNVPVWVRTMRSFCEQYRHCPAEFASRLGTLDDEFRRAELLRDLHGFRGLSATLGAEALAAEIGRLEEGIRAGQGFGPLAHMLDQVSLNLAKAIARIETECARLDENPGLSEPPPACYGTETPELLATFADALSDRDMVAMDLYARLRKVLEDLDPELVGDMDRALERLDFVSAGKICTTFRARVCA